MWIPICAASYYSVLYYKTSILSTAHTLNLSKASVTSYLPYDPFGDDRMIYTIRNHCVENPELPYEDGARTIFLYTKGRKGRDNEKGSTYFT